MIDRRHDRAPHRLSRGQILPLAAILMTVVLALTGLGLDGARVFLERREAQGAADLAALAAARSLPADTTQAKADALKIGIANGYAAEDITVITNYKGDPSKVRVEIDSATDFLFLPVIGLGDMDVGAGAAALAAGATASCSFCSLNGTDDNHTLVLKNGSTLRVDGDIMVNSTDGYDPSTEGPNDCELAVWDEVDEKWDGKAWMVCGDGFDIFGSPVTPPSYISAKSISVSGGWETHDENVVMADGPVWPDYSTYPPTYRSCPYISPDPPAQTQTSNVCIHVPQIADPLNDPSNPSAIVPVPVAADYGVPDATSCPSGTMYPTTVTSNDSALTINADATLCPGVYYGGIEITAGTTTLLPGVYYVIGKDGFVVGEAASLDGTSGVMIYASGSEHNPLPPSVDIAPDPDLAPEPVPGRIYPKLTKIEGKDNPIEVGKEVKYKLEFEAVPTETGPLLNGVIRFYDGTTEISGSTADCPATTITNEDKKAKGECKFIYDDTGIGTHGISAIFISTDTCSDASCYNSFGTVQDPRQVVVPASGSGSNGDIVFDTLGSVRLKPLDSGAFKGIVLYQDRDTDGNITLSHATGATACSPATPLTTPDGITGPEWALIQPPGDPCGALGGIEGTIYAPHWDSTVETTASGLGDIQIIAGELLITSEAVTRFAYDEDKFAGNRLVLIE